MHKSESVTRSFMKALIFSDSHEKTSFMKKIVKDNPTVDYVFFLGDGLSDFEEVRAAYPDKIYYAVRGNCDAFMRSLSESYEYDRVLEIEGKRIWLTHGHMNNVKYGETNIFYKAKQNKIDIVLYGHTHTRSENYYPAEDGGIYTFCPGSIGEAGFNNCVSYGKLQIDKSGIILSHGSIGIEEL